MISLLIWYLFISLLGWITVPLVFRLLPHLPGRGFAFARPLGLILWGFIFFLLISFGLIQNDAGGVLLTFLLVAALGIWVWLTRQRELFAYLAASRGMVITVEVLFLAAFAFMALYRAADPAIIGTEKPMEMMFINSILRSESFPPHDAWLSGYAISYYYFGYIMVAMITRLTGTNPGVAFNLAVSLWYALSAISAYGVAYSLLSALGQRRLRKDDSQLSAPSPAWALLAPLFVLVVSNLEGFLEMLHKRGIFWTQAPDGSLQSGFWQWLNIQELCTPPSQPFSWTGERLGGIWWWRASRILHDFDMTHYARQSLGETCIVGREIIDEFPFFSYLLADLHPHVLAMPFALLAVALAMNLYFRPRRMVSGGMDLWTGVTRFWTGSEVHWKELEVVGWLRQADFWLAAVVLGGLAFLNTWDFPIYVALTAAAYALARYERAGWSGRRIGEFIEFAVLLGLAGILLYLPFYIGFASQAGGILPSVIFFTRGAHFWVMFASLLLPILAWLIWLYRRERSWAGLWRGLRFSLAVIFILWFASFLFGWLASNLTAWGSLLASDGSVGVADRLIELGSAFTGLQGTGDTGTLFSTALIKRLSTPGAWLSMLVLLALAWGMVSLHRRDIHRGVPSAPSTEEEARDRFSDSDLNDCGSPNVFAILMVITGLGLVIVPEFFYLRDLFGWRMNTIFKFYYQAWILLAVIAAFASAVLWRQLRSAARVVFGLVWMVLLLMSLAYPYFGLVRRFNTVRVENLTLDGTAYLAQSAPDEMAAIEWMRRAEPGTVVEAVYGGYQPNTLLLSVHSGQPAVLGWTNHESQWRGGYTEIGTRQADVARLYETSNWDEAETILRQYNIRYVYLSEHEWAIYRVNDSKFEAFMKPVFRQGSVVIYEAPGYEPYEAN